MTKREFIKKMKELNERREYGKLVDYNIDKFYNGEFFAISIVISNHVVYRYDFEQHGNIVDANFVRIL